MPEATHSVPECECWWSTTTGRRDRRLRECSRRAGFPSSGLQWSGSARPSGAGDEKIDIVLSDVTMPGMTGIDLSYQIRSLSPDCRSPSSPAT